MFSRLFVRFSGLRGWPPERIASNDYHQRFVSVIGPLSLASTAALFFADFLNGFV